MKTFRLFIGYFIIFFSIVLFGQNRPSISFEDLMINAELEYRNVIEARKAAVTLGVPINIYLGEGIFIEAKAVEDEKPVYAVMRNILHPFVNADVMFYEEILSTFNIENARINFGNGVIINPNVGIPEIDPQTYNRAVSYILAAESSTDRVALLDFATGDIVNIDYVLSQGVLSTPKEARLSPRATITISDQVTDAVFDYDTLGVLIGIFAPAGGVNTAILDNVRGHNFRPNGNLVVTVGGGGNNNSVPQFDNLGVYLGQFITAGLGGLSSPFDIIFRANDVLVTGSSSNAAHRYDLSGNYLDNFVTGQSFPQQIVEFPNGNIGIANFSTGGGLRIFDPSGTQINNFTSVTGLRGVHYLGNGNIIVTNASGVHEIDGTTGALVRTIIAGVGGQYVSPYDLDIVPVELTSFSADVVGNNIVLNWVTATEINNSGFAIERGEDNINFSHIGFVAGSGTTTETRNYTFTDNSVTSSTYYYRLKQIDYNGSYEFSEVIEVEIGLPAEFTLEQNYPNPFNPATSIRFTLPVDAKVKIGVYNLLGEKVSEVVNKEFEAGTHIVEFNADSFTSGVYFYQIDASGSNGKTFSNVKKMTLLK